MFLSWFWAVDTLLSAIFLLLGVFCGLRFIVYRDAAADHYSYVCYSVSLVVLAPLPILNLMLDVALHGSSYAFLVRTDDVTSGIINRLLTRKHRPVSDICTKPSYEYTA